LEAKTEGFRCVLIVLVSYGVLYPVLMMLENSRTTAVAGAVVFFLTASLLFYLSIKQRGTVRGNYSGIFSGLFFWASIGELLESAGFVKIESWMNMPLYFALLLMFLLLWWSGQISSSPAFGNAHFLAIWGLHAYMVNQYNLLGKTHWSTYLSAFVFGMMAVLFAFKLTKAKSRDEAMAYGLAMLLTGWTVIEYLWGWGIVPGP